MSESCKKLHDFAYGELSEGAADAFRLHLGSCESCPAELGELLQLIALEEAATAAEPAKESSVAQPEYAEAPIDELAARRRKRLAFVGVALAAAAIAFLVLRSGKTGEPSELVIATAETRPLELRVSAADAYRPYEVMRSGEYPVEEISLSILAKLQERGEKQRLANAHLLMREADKAEALLAELEPTASILADRGVAAALRGDNHAALRYFAESLELEPDNARVLWNQAIVYRDLNLPLGAAKLFDRVAKLGEPGWSEEAAKNAAALRGAKEAAESYKKAYQNGSRQIAEGKVLALDIVTRYPGLGRLLFYDAVRSADSSEALAALEPHAKALDTHYGGSNASTTILRLRKTDWSLRAPLAKAYQKLVLSQDAAAAEGLSNKARAKGLDDIVFGALVLSRPSDPALIPELRAFAKQSGDPWFVLLADATAADALIMAARVREANAMLDELLASCRVAPIPFRCARIAASSIRSRAVLFLIEAARDAAIEGLDWANQASDVYSASRLRISLAQAELNADEVESTSSALARAYLEEELLGTTDSCTLSYSYLLLADLSSRQGRYERASKEDELFERERQRCGQWPLDPGIAYIRAIILGRGLADSSALKAFRDEVETLRETSSSSAKAGFDLAEGVALLRASPTDATRLLERSVGAVDSMSKPNTASLQYRAWAALHLVMKASEEDRAVDVLKILAQETKLPVPSSCAVALAFERRLAVVVVDDGGAVTGRHDPDYALAEPALTASEIERLRGCEQVRVIARAPFYGRSQLLPDDFSWSFVTGGPTEPPLGVQAKRIVVANVNAPSDLGLPELQKWTAPVEDGFLVKGSAATPERVLAELETATAFEVHVHGILGSLTGDAYLALTPNESGDFRLTAEKISETNLRGRPLVILGACNAGRSGSYLHEPWGLPIAFRKAGARAIFASPNPIPDSSSSAFFAALRQKLDSGLSPAVALRDVRLQWRSRSPDSSQWAAEILVFE